MGACCSAPGAELAAASDKEIELLQEKGRLPCVAVPKEDHAGNNNLQTVYVAQYREWDRTYLAISRRGSSQQVRRLFL